MAAVNPFAALSSAKSAPQSVESPAEKPEPPPPANAVMVYDLETVPDESRFPRPEVNPEATTVPNLDIAGFFEVCKTIPQITSYLGHNPLSRQQYDDLLEIEQATEKPRKGVVDVICQARDNAVSAFETWKKDCSVNPLKCRIVAFGWAIGNSRVQSLLASDDDAEREILEKFWSLVATGRRRAGYNITGFDDAVIGIRSLLLGVSPTVKLTRKKYGNHQALDLMTLLFPNSTAQKLKDVCDCLRIVPPAGDMDGSRVFELFDAGKLAEIAAYVESDVWIERELMWKLGEVFAE